MARATSILIVDDDDDFRQVLRVVLEAEGCAVYEAADGKTALGILRIDLPNLLGLLRAIDTPEQLSRVPRLGVP